MSQPETLAAPLTQSVVAQPFDNPGSPAVEMQEGCCSSCFHCILKCLNISDPPETSRVQRPPPHETYQYQAPVITPPAAVALRTYEESYHEEREIEKNRLLPKYADSSASVVSRTTNTRDTEAASHTGMGPSTSTAAPTHAASRPAIATDSSRTVPVRHRHSSSGKGLPRSSSKGHRKNMSDEGVIAGHSMGARPASPAWQPTQPAVDAGTARDTTTSSAATAAAAAAAVGTPGPAPLVVQDEDDEICSTCLEVYTSDNPKIFTECGHHFHMPCILEWLERKNTCPMCESPMNFPGLQ
uniref:RING-type E3 ubiquitin transferase n=1 Tax=Chlamydomonas chlamydogama TaxID=225041 RepID=A0A7S2QU42_9CHLO|mmetsp:Transcript_328/g.661  ORF Transcript_328/g.661 Transcript_328/m.661 type:complete len:298 (+) Transcript_328:126-1019(+)|eukprot:CAMPEP_0202895374 /NCGR_PEP_ID=MMETSP1392-20130828/4597_1 /ASSEMBLY_ACC=CAM_ASM_000868 /TAXON_ID=225041 /ORGANISM="Chlamydomonas chlamydogama, Strain SAG 11-48b" /LENGTH=297 /DNA_ID=CAMNT_0049580369 /DNA_START=114 /DNA_END=1007 /DNA_ORIENTATION=+